MRDLAVFLPFRKNGDKSYKKNTMNNFEITRTTRQNVLNLLKGFTVEQMNMVPSGSRNNLVWHLGHLLVTQQLLTYNLSGHKLKIPNELVDKFRKGSEPTKTYNQEEINELKEEFLEVVDTTEADYKAGIFTEFTTYETSFGITLSSIEDAVKFNNVHEGLHMGLIMAMRKLV